MATTGTIVRPARVWRIVLGAVFVLWSLGGVLRTGGLSLLPLLHGDIAGTVGRLTGLAVLLVLGGCGIWLIRSGLPKGLDQAYIAKTQRDLKKPDPPAS